MPARSAEKGSEMLSVSAVEAGYRGTRVLRGVDLTVARGEFVVIIGPNGHGKTTLLKAISGLVPVTSGHIELDGARIDRLTPDRIVGRGVVQIPQGDLLFPDMTVEENLVLGAFRERSSATRGQRLDHVFEVFPRLAERRSQRARTLSGGERRMLALGRGLMSDAQLLMIDEPSLGLAPVLVEEVYSRISRIAEEGKTVLLVEENPARVAGLADRLYLMENGSMVRSGDPDQVLADEAVISSYLGTTREGM
jgi:branched-chain amino acid transport system ATP-binding protein